MSESRFIPSVAKVFFVQTLEFDLVAPSAADRTPAIKTSCAYVEELRKHRQRLTRLDDGHHRGSKTIVVDSDRFAKQSRQQRVEESRSAPCRLR